MRSWQPRPRVTALAERQGRWSRVLIDRTPDVAHLPVGSGARKVVLVWWGFRDFCCWLVHFSTFNSFVTFLILLNTTCLAVEHYNMSRGFERNLNLINDVLTCVA